jgi:hypothetical protein
VPIWSRFARGHLCLRLDVAKLRRFAAVLLII